jgi:hypothetical protein
VGRLRSAHAELREPQRDAGSLVCLALGKAQAHVGGVRGGALDRLRGGHAAAEGDGDVVETLVELGANLLLSGIEHAPHQRGLLG